LAQPKENSSNSGFAQGFTQQNKSSGFKFSGVSTGMNESQGFSTKANENSSTSGFAPSFNPQQPKPNGFKFSGVSTSMNESQGFSAKTHENSYNSGISQGLNSQKEKADPFKPVNLEPDSQCRPKDFIYSNLSEISSNDKEVFESSSFYFVQDSFYSSTQRIMLIFYMVCVVSFN
jgi:hypothetical protein